MIHAVEVSTSAEESKFFLIPRIKALIQANSLPPGLYLTCFFVYNIHTYTHRHMHPNYSTITSQIYHKSKDQYLSR